MKRFLLFLFLSFLAVPHVWAADDCVLRTDVSASPYLKRGINLSQWWERTTFNALTPVDLARVRALGFDFARLPVSPGWPLLDDEGERQEKMARLRCDIVSVLNSGLNIVVDLHEMGKFRQDLMDRPEKALPALTLAWERLKPVIDGLPPSRIFIGLYNEPGIGKQEWWRIQEELAGNLRAIYPRNTFIAAAGEDSGPWHLAEMQPYKDKNIIYDFHYYLPMYFTHHAAEWLGADPEEREIRVPYPVTKKTQPEKTSPVLQEYLEDGWNRRVLAGHIRKIARWSKEAGAKVACLEFGVYRPYVDDRSRHSWLRDMRELLEEANIPWALWEYRGAFGLADMHNRVDEGVVRALGLRHNRGR